MLLAVTATAGAIWIGLIRVRSVSHRLALALTATAVVGVAAMVDAATTASLSTEYLVLLGPVCVFAGLFFEAREVLGFHALVLAAGWLALAGSEGAR